jgi:hypothetical protein
MRNWISVQQASFEHAYRLGLTTDAFIERAEAGAFGRCYRRRGKKRFWLDTNQLEERIGRNGRDYRPRRKRAKRWALSPSFQI